MNTPTFLGDPRLRTASIDGARWLTHLQLWSPTGQDQLVTGDHETAVVLLRGTFDLHGGPTAWPARGARRSEYEGRPMAVYLPKHTTFRAEHGQGEILLVAAKQPAAAPGTNSDGRAGLGLKALLPLAGSGKSFDPNSGEWRPAETFPSAPESLPPRRMTRLPCGALWVERVLAADYKAATLCIDEVVLQPGQTLGIADIPERPKCDELLLFVRTEGTVQLGTAGDGTPAHTARGELVFAGEAAVGTAQQITAQEGRTYVLVAYAGK